MIGKVFHSFQISLRNSPSYQGMVEESRYLTLMRSKWVWTQEDTIGDKDEVYLKECIKLGLVKQLNNQRYSSFAKDHLIFPFKDEKGTIVNLYGQPLKKGKQGKCPQCEPRAFSIISQHRYATHYHHHRKCVLEAAQVASSSKDTYTTIMALDDGLFTERHQLALMYSGRTDRGKF